MGRHASQAGETSSWVVVDDMVAAERKEAWGHFWSILRFGGYALLTGMLVEVIVVGLVILGS